MESNSMKLIREAAAQRNEVERAAEAEKQAKKDARHKAIMNMIQPLVDIANEVAANHPERVEVKVTDTITYVWLLRTKDPRWAFGHEPEVKALIQITVDTKHTGIMIKGRRSDGVSSKPIGERSLMDLSQATAALIDVFAHAIR